MTRRLLICLLLLTCAFPAAAFAAHRMTVTIPLTDSDIASIERNGERRLQVGIVKSADATLDLSSVRPEDLGRGPGLLPFGRIQRTDDGFTWTGSIASPGAAALRIHFTEFFLPNNARLTLSNASGQAFAYTEQGPAGTGEFWSNTLLGDTVNLRVDYRGNDLGRVLQALRFVVPEIGPISSKLPGAEPQAGDELCSYNRECVVNASCVATPAAVETAKKAVAMILFISGPYQYVCSGGLVADRDLSSNIPYFITANHCLSSSGEAATVEAYFNYTTACGTCNDSLSGVPVVLGSSVMASNRTSDFTLLRLSQPAPSGALFLDWNNTPVANSNGTPLYRISHPAGAPQAYSSQTVDTSRATCRSWPRGNWIYSSDGVGATEGGSSGSPVVNAAGQLVGQLSGACGFNPSDACDATANATVDGAFAAYYSSVSQFLGAATPCTDADGDGYCVSVDCNDNNANVNPGRTESCSDGIDNNCNNLIDAQDPACATGGCDLLPSGSPCSANDQCCSSNCKGKPGSKTCK